MIKSMMVNDCKTFGIGFDIQYLLCGSSSIGRVPDFQSGCCGFESRLPLQMRYGLIPLGYIKTGRGSFNRE